MTQNARQIAEDFARLVESRSSETSHVFDVFAFRSNMAGTLVGKLREELDSLIRVIYLQNTPSISERLRLMSLTLAGEKWTRLTHNGKYAQVTDRDMVEVANNLNGWSESVYRFGCAFIHLSSFHDYQHSDPFAQLDPTEQADILRHMRAYHDGPRESSPTFADIVDYIPMIYIKIRDNLDCRLKDLLRTTAP
ncbi:MAG: hypothetical protein WAZ19_13830 [Anaerolineae bacterium]